MKREHQAYINGTEETKKLIGVSNGRYLFEDGWWMTEKDHHELWPLDRVFPRQDVILNRNEETKQITFSKLII